MEITEVGSGANKENEGASMRQKMLEISEAEKQEAGDKKESTGDEASKEEAPTEVATKRLSGYEFKVVPAQDPRVFPNFRREEVGKKLYQWGMADNITMQKFRFNRNFQLIGADEFLKDLFNSSEVIRNFGPLMGLSPGECTGVKFTQLRCDVLNMSYFDVLQEIGVISASGDIRGNFEEIIDGITCGNRLMQVMICEDYDDPDAYDTIHDDKYQKEFIFKVLEHFALGGSLCQYDDKFGEYLEVVKLMYKDLVAVAKDPDSQ